MTAAVLVGILFLYCKSLLINFMSIPRRESSFNKNIKLNIKFYKQAMFFNKMLQSFLKRCTQNIQLLKKTL